MSDENKNDAFASVNEAAAAMARLFGPNSTRPDTRTFDDLPDGPPVWIEAGRAKAIVAKAIRSATTLIQGSGEDPQTVYDELMAAAAEAIEAEGPALIALVTVATAPGATETVAHIVGSSESIGDLMDWAETVPGARLRLDLLSPV